MLPIKKAGFTLIEILVATGIFVAISVTVFSFLATNFKSTSKTAVSEEVRQNGSYALSTIERLVVSSRAISCPNNQSVNVTALDGSTTLITCSGGRIASGSSFLTSSNVAVSSCNFSGSTEPGLPPRLDVSFTVSQLGTPDRPSEKDSLSFQTKILLKNRQN